MYIKRNKSQRKVENADKRKAITDYRKIQYRKAMDRDYGKCVFCWFLKGRVTNAVDVHHVFGRANKSGKNLWKEEYTNLLCTCRECHPQPITFPGGSSKLSYVEEVLILANENPINKSFRKF